MLKKVTLLTFLIFSLLATPSFARIIEHHDINSELNNKIIVNDDDLLFKDVVMNKEKTTKTYTVKKGDNLYRIALSHDISLEDLIAWNGLESDLIYPGDELIISGDKVDKNSINKGNKFAHNKNESSKLKTVSQVDAEPAGKELTVTATAYTAYCEGCSGTTAYGIDLRSNPNQKVIAVDPKIIPLGTKVWVEGYGVAIAGDTGGAIKGNKIDVFIPTYEEAMQWGVKKIKIKILE